MLTIAQFDAASARVIDRMLTDGRLANLANLRNRGEWRELDAPATQFAAGAQYTLYSGVEIEDHGLFYPFQWDPSTQRVHYTDHFPAPPPIWERLGREKGTRTLAVDPYESRPPIDPPPGELVCGWQLHDRVVLRQWDSPEGTHGRLERLFGRPQPVDEVFGRHTAAEMLGLRSRLLDAPGRVADAAIHLLDDAPFDLAWLTFCAAHVAGHQFWDLSQIDADGLDADASRVLGTALDDVYMAVDRALGRLVDAVPADGDLIVLSPVGMDVNTSRADLLPEMLERVLDPDPDRSAGDEPTGGPSGSIWKLRAMVPSGMRAKVANALPERAALDLTSRLEMRGVDWSTTRAFAHPAENQGYVRLNLRGRERDGIVEAADATALMDDIAKGLSTFRHLDGSPAVASIEVVADRFGSGARSDLLPDMIVKWVDTPATDLDALVSDRFGKIHRHGVGSGRSGNHTEGDAWALLIPGSSSRLVEPSRAPRLEDIAATAAAMSGADTTEMVGTPLMEPA